MRWWIARAGLFFSVFAVVALSGPGRIDIVDGQTRYEVARSLVEHGDSVIRDPNVWFAVFPGRDGLNYTKYRFPQSAAGVAAIWAADGYRAGQRSPPPFLLHTHERRGQRQPGRDLCLTVSMPGPLATRFIDLGGGGCVLHPKLVLRNQYVRRHPGIGGRGSCGVGGLDQPARPSAGRDRLSPAWHWAWPSIARNRWASSFCPSWRHIGEPGRDWWGRWREHAAVVLLLAASVGLYLAYDRYKFPPGSTAGHVELLKRYVPWWSAHPEVALLALLFSLGRGVLFYNPAIVICCSGLRGWWRREERFCQALLAAVTVFVVFICFLTFFKGDPAWGPRYLTPIFAVLWIFAPAGARLERPWVVAAALGLGLVIQMGALCIDYHRLYIERGLPSAFYVAAPDLYFHPGISHLMNRPREIVEVLSNQDGPATCYSPSPSPTFAFPVLDFVEKEPQPLRKYHILNSLRFWWASYLYLDRQSRPVDVARTVAVLIAMALTGLLLQIG